MIKLKKLLNEKRYSFERKFGEPLPTLKDTINKRRLEESKKYPPQEEAEALAEWYNAINSIYFGGSIQVRKEFEKSDKVRLKLHPKIFGDKSPWTLERKGNKVKVKWDSEKARNLGL